MLLSTTALILYTAELKITGATVRKNVSVIEPYESSLRLRSRFAFLLDMGRYMRNRIRLKNSAVRAPAPVPIVPPAAPNASGYPVVW